MLFDVSSNLIYDHQAVRIKYGFEIENSHVRSFQHFWLCVTLNMCKRFLAVDLFFPPVGVS